MAWFKLLSDWLFSGQCKELLAERDALLAKKEEDYQLIRKENHAIRGVLQTMAVQKAIEDKVKEIQGHLDVVKTVYTPKPEEGDHP